MFPRFAVLMLPLLLCWRPASAVINGGERQVVDFRERTVATVFWPEKQSSPLALETVTQDCEPTSAGIVCPAEAVLLLPPLETGMVNRPLTGTSILVTLSGDHLSTATSVSVRHSTTGKLWSPWEKIPPKPQVKGVIEYEGTVIIPGEKRTRYRSRWNEWAYHDKPTGGFRGDNEDEYIAYLRVVDPEVFDVEIPLIFFVQFALVPNAGAVVAEVSAHTSWAVSGISQ